MLARPTRSVVLYLQAVGRGMRSATGKEHVVLIDHGRVVENLGLPTYDRDWSLTGENVNTQAAHKLAESRIHGEEKPRHCRECGCTWVLSEDGSNCPNCGWQPVPRPRAVRVVAADLGEIAANTTPPVNLQPFYQEACGWYARRWPERWELKPNSGRFWAWSQTRTKFKRPDDERMPSRFWDLPKLEPTPETAGWLKAMQIRWFKGRQAREARASA